MTKTELIANLAVQTKMEKKQSKAFLEGLTALVEKQIRKGGEVPLKGLGKFKVVPKPDAQFRASDELNVYFQVYNPAADPATGKPKMDIEYHFRSKNADGTYSELGAYSVKESAAQVQGYAVALQKWPAGEYQVSIVVRDLLAGTVAESSAVFTLRG